MRKSTRLVYEVVGHPSSRESAPRVIINAFDLVTVASNIDANPLS